MRGIFLTTTILVPLVRTIFSQWLLYSLPHTIKPPKPFPRRNLNIYIYKFVCVREKKMWNFVLEIVAMCVCAFELQFDIIMVRNSLVLLWILIYGIEIHKIRILYQFQTHFSYPNNGFGIQGSKFNSMPWYWSSQTHLNAFSGFPGIRLLRIEVFSTFIPWCNQTVP